MTKPKPKADPQVAKATPAPSSSPRASAARKDPPAKRTPTPEVQVAASVCPSCGSTERIGYHGTKARALSGVLEDGRRYQVVIWKRTQCRNCEQPRVDVFHLDRPYKKDDGELLE